MENLELENIDNEMAELAEIFREESARELAEKNEWKEKLKDLINIDSFFEHLNESLETWSIIGIVEIYLTDEKIGGYSTYQCVRIKDDKDKLLYMKQPEDECEGIDHCCVWQTVGCCEDDYSGYLLYPLKDGNYVKLSYSC